MNCLKSICSTSITLQIDIMKYAYIDVQIPSSTTVAFPDPRGFIHLCLAPITLLLTTSKILPITSSSKDLWLVMDQAGRINGVQEA
ncbi:hypothetical protein K7X08_033450 [Anisodus acutangulus]|uniref:Uncharacterized protein n=1 Tax=Anisodus acutangulus TaxID=402998 RepID=A0A9Q1M4Z8_9SOLA|nr:hypothetical protein K7X08_033450 [Anisodus acutangulus]